MYRQNPSHPGLRLKPVSSADPTIFSVRIGRSYRALAIRDDEGSGMIWFWIGSHGDYDREIERF